MAAKNGNPDTERSAFDTSRSGHNAQILRTSSGISYSILLPQKVLREEKLENILLENCLRFCKILKKSDKSSGKTSSFKTNGLKIISYRTTSDPTEVRIYILQLYVPTIIQDGQPRFDYKESKRASFI